MFNRRDSTMKHDDFERAVLQVIRNNNLLSRFRRKKIEFSKCLMVFASTICAGTWLVSAISWFVWREFPFEAVQYTLGFFGAVAAYMGKSAYENKPKIQNQKPDDNEPPVSEFVEGYHHRDEGHHRRERG